MKQKRLFQILVLLPLLFAPFGANQPVRASTGTVNRLNSRNSSHHFPGLQNGPIVSVHVSPGSVNVGGITSVMVRLNHVPAEGYTSVELTCIYDPDFVQTSNIVVGNLFGIDPVTAINGPYNGQFIVAIAGSDGKKAVSSGVILAFNVRGLQEGQSSLECQARVSTGDNALKALTSVGTKVTILENALTPTAGPALCDKVQFVADVTVPDGTNFPPGAMFTKTWRLKNVGSCTWTTSYQLVFFSGEQMGAVSSAPFPRSVSPGQTVDISVNMTAPSSVGSYRGFWMFKNSNGTLFGIGAQANKPWWLDIRVSGATATSTTTAAMRITIGPGQTTASRIGVVNPNETIRYLLNAAAGQVLSINLTAPANEVAIGVNGPTGLALKPLDASPIWNATISEGGDHTITLMALTGSSSKSYTLQVSLTPSAPTATPTFRPTPCDRAEFVADVNIPPGTVISPGAQFIKTWRLKNVGTCTWTLSYRVAFFLGDQMGAPSSIQIPRSITPGEMVDISLPITAPLATGSYRGYWIFQNSTGLPFGVGSQGNEPWFVDLMVANGSVTPTFTPPSNVLKLTKSPSSQTYNAPDQTITYTFNITNTGTTALGPAQFTITDDKLGAPFNCGPANVTLAPGESVICSMDYRTTSADMGLSNITNSATAAGAGQVSPPATAVVINLVAAATPTPSMTPGRPTATPIPGTVYDFVANACAATWSSGAGALPCPGIDGDLRGFVIRLSNPQLETGEIATRPGLLTFPQNLRNGYIQGLYPAFHVQTGDRFRSTIGCEGGATDCYVGFRLDYQIGADPIRTFWGPFVERYNGRTYSIDADLSSLAGQDVRFILTVLAAGQPSGDRALWVGPIIYRSAAAPSSTPATPTLESPTPTLTPTPIVESDWLRYINTKYWFEFYYPPQGHYAGDSMTANHARIILPFTPDTNLYEKYLDVTVVEDSTLCRSPLASSSTVDSVGMAFVNGTVFLQESGHDRTAVNINRWFAFSTSRDNVCVSLDLVLRATNPDAGSTPPPFFDEVAEFAVLQQMVGTYAWLTPPTATPDGTPIPTATHSSTPVESPTLPVTPLAGTGTVTGQVLARQPVTVDLFDTGNRLVASILATSDGRFSLTAPAGTYNIVADAHGFLSARGSVTITDGSISTKPTISLLAGDIDGDFTINHFDALTIGMNYNTSFPESADLNNDGIINVLDLELLAGNYRKIGPVFW